MQNTLKPPVFAPPPPAARSTNGIFRSGQQETAPAGLVQTAGFLLVLSFAFMVFARIPEFVQIKTGIQVPIIMAVSVLAMAAALVAGDSRRIAKMPAVLWLLAFTLW